MSLPRYGDFQTVRTRNLSWLDNSGNPPPAGSLLTIGTNSLLPDRASWTRDPSLNSVSLTGGGTLTYSGGSLLVNGVPVGNVDLTGLYNTLRIIPTATGLSTSTIYYAGVGGVGYPSKWIPDASTNITLLPSDPTPGIPWRLTKPSGGLGRRWWVWPFNLYPNAIPLTSPPTGPASFLRSELQAVWAVIRIKTSNIVTQGAFFFNIYTYSNSLTPLTTFTTRFDYSANVSALPLATSAMTFVNEYRYLVYAFDAPKIIPNPALTTTIAISNGQFPVQTTSQMLRDPFDIYTTIPHIGFPAVAYTNAAPVSANLIITAPVSAISFGCTSSSIASGVDIEVESVGYRAKDGAINEDYLLRYSP